MGFSGSVNGITKNPGFWILVFANVNGPIMLYSCIGPIINPFDILLLKELVTDSVIDE